MTPKGETPQPVPVVLTDEQINEGLSEIARPEFNRQFADAIMFLRLFVSRKNTESLKPKVHDWLTRHHYDGGILRDDSAPPAERAPAPAATLLAQPETRKET